MRPRFDFANPASNTARHRPFQCRNAGVSGVLGGASLIKALHLPWLPLYLIAVCAYQPVLGRQAAIAALVIAAEALTKRLTTGASKKCRGAKRQASPAYWI
jgi:ABC-type protease/lipase transport system fused ATPase/permease subunit